jgi:hypothetical protein
MGGFASTVQQPQTGSSGKGYAPQADTQPNPNPNAGTPQPMGKGGRQTNSATSGQPTMGAPNSYPNTVGQWDNTQIQPLPSKNAGKGKGG